MTVSAMRAIDRFAGVPLCWLAGIALRALRLVRPAPAPGAPERILFIKFFGMGSIILSMPAVAEARRRFPGARIAYLSFAQHRPILERYGIIDEVLAIDPAAPGTFVRTTWRAVRELRARRFDTVIDFEFFSKFSTLLASLSGAPRRSGFLLPTLWRRLHLTHAAPLSKSEHVTAAFARQVAALAGSPAPELRLLGPTVTEADHRALELKAGLNGAPFVVLHVCAGATFPERRWPAERFAGLIRTAADAGGATVCLTGTQEERAYVDSVIDASGCRPRCANLAGTLSLGELAALLGRAELVVSNDSGPLHLAAALGTRVVGLYGPESPTFYGPLGERATVLYKPTPCSPCMNVYAAKNYRCPYHARCMQQIDVGDVAEHLETVAAR